MFTQHVYVDMTYQSSEYKFISTHVHQANALKAFWVNLQALWVNLRAFSVNLRALWVNFEVAKRHLCKQ